jgi:RNA polymerase sigma factor (sigma-70 family)
MARQALAVTNLNSAANLVHRQQGQRMIASDTTLSRLMALSQDGDAVAYRTVLSECQSWLTRYYRGRIAPVMIDDLIQETMISLHSKRASYDPARPFLPWLAAIARYRWIDQLRRTYRAAEEPLDERLSVDAEGNAVIARISLEHLLGLLPEGQARAIRLVKIDGLSVAQAAARTGQSEPLIKVNVHRGIKRLAALIEKE